MRDCKKIEDLLVLYGEGKLNAKLASEVKEHLEICPGCSDLAGKILQAASAVKNLPKVKLPDNFVSEVRAKVDELNENEQPLSKPWLSFNKIFIPAFGFAAAVMLAVFSINYVFVNKNIPVTPRHNAVVKQIQTLASGKNNETQVVKVIELAKYTNPDEAPVVFRGAGNKYENKMILKQWKGLKSGVKESETLLITSQNQWDVLWKKHAGPAAVIPEIDFNKSIVVAAFMGEKHGPGSDI